MELITKKLLLERLPESWKYQYHDSQTIIYQALLNEPNLTEDRAEEIIGNRSWTKITCDECKNEVDEVIRLGEEPDDESSTAAICINCLRLALNTFDSLQSEKQGV